jgi:hypothetical protein
MRSAISRLVLLNGLLSTPAAELVPFSMCRLTSAGDKMVKLMEGHAECMR